MAGTHGTSATTLPLAADAKGTSPYTTPSQKLPEAYAHLPQMERSICQFLIKQPPQDEGIHIKVITKGVPGAGASDVRFVSELKLLVTCSSSYFPLRDSAALDRLLDEGHVFTTMDDSHYALSV